MRFHVNYVQNWYINLVNANAHMPMPVGLLSFKLKNADELRNAEIAFTVRIVEKWIAPDHCNVQRTM